MTEKKSPNKEQEKTINLSEWQKKNQAYLEKRAQEKEERALEDAKKKAESQARVQALREAANQLYKGQLPDEKEPSEQEGEPNVEVESVDDEDRDTGTSEVLADEDEESDQEEASDSQVSEREDKLLSEEEEEGELDQELPEEEVDKPTSKPKKKSKKQGGANQSTALTKGLENPKKPAWDWSLFFKALPFLTVALGLCFLSLYFLSPWSRSKNLKVTGNAQVSSEDILAMTGISEEDYTLTTWLHQDQYAQAIESQLIWVKSARMTYEFPIDFNVDIEEYRVVAYAKSGGDHYPILSSGNVLNRPVTEAEVPQPIVIIQLTDLEMIKTFVIALESLDPTLLTRVETVKLSPTAASPDLLNLTMREGHTVLVPLSSLSEKMAYYDKIAAKLTEASLIDMEAGIYSYTK